MSTITAPLETVRAEDFIEYYLFPDVKQSSTSDISTVLEDVIQQITKISKQYTSTYIWHKDSFRVTSRYGNANLLIENQLDNCGNILFYMPSI